MERWTEVTKVVINMMCMSLSLPVMGRHHHPTPISLPAPPPGPAAGPQADAAGGFHIGRYAVMETYGFVRCPVCRICRCLDERDRTDRQTLWERGRCPPYPLASRQIQQCLLWSKRSVGLSKYSPHPTVSLSLSLFATL